MLENNEEQSRIEEMKKRLYSRRAKGFGPRKRRRLRGHDAEVGRGWKGGTLPPREYTPLPLKEKKSILPILLAASAVFFVAAIGISLILFFSSSNVSPRNVNIVVQGPATIGGGEEMTLQITIINKNSVAMEAVDLIVEFPKGTRSVADLSVELPRVRESIGIIEPGGRVQKTIRAVLFGQEQSRQDMNITVEYRVEGSNAIFFADQTYQLTLGTNAI